jgi:hypothetical protein
MSRHLVLAACHICHVHDRPINLYICRYCSKPVCRKDSEPVVGSQLKTRVCAECVKKITKAQ